jgi:hypothetical protein
LNLCTFDFNLLSRFSLAFEPWLSLLNFTMLLCRLWNFRFKLITFDGSLIHYRLGCVKLLIAAVTIQLISFSN